MPPEPPSKKAPTYPSTADVLKTINEALRRFTRIAGTDGAVESVKWVARLGMTPCVRIRWKAVSRRVWKTLRHQDPRFDQCRPQASYD